MNQTGSIVEQLAERINNQPDFPTPPTDNETTVPPFHQGEQAFNELMAARLPWWNDNPTSFIIDDSGYASFLRVSNAGLTDNNRPNAELIFVETFKEAFGLDVTIEREYWGNFIVRLQFPVDFPR